MAGSANVLFFPTQTLAAPADAPISNPAMDESWDTFARAEDQYERHLWAQACENYHKLLPLDAKLNITRPEAARHYVKAARELKNQTYLEEAITHLKKVRASDGYILGDPYYGIKKVHLTLVAPPGSLWNPNQPPVLARIAKLFEVHGLELIPHAVIGSDAAELQLTVKTTSKGGRFLGEITYEFWRMDPPEKLLTPTAQPLVKSGRALVPQVLGKPSDAEALINGQLEVFFDHIDDSRVE